MNIRRAKSTDLDELARLWRELADLHAGLAPEFALVPDAERMFRRHIAEVVADENCCVLVAEEDGALVGFINGGLHENAPVFVERFVGEIASAVVTETSRRQGVGTQLVDGLLTWFRERGVKVVTLGAATANPIAQSFWRKMGFDAYMTKLRREI